MRTHKHSAGYILEELRRLRRGARTLSVLERQAIGALFAGDYSHDRRVNNGLQRARRKLRAAA